METCDDAFWNGFMFVDRNNTAIYEAVDKEYCCEACDHFDKMLDEAKSMSGFAYERFVDKIYKDWRNNCIKSKKPSHKGNGKHNGIFAGTLTISTDEASEASEEQMCDAIKKIMTQKTVEVKRYAWYLERTKNDIPHIHFIYETITGGRIHAKIFKRYWKIWDESVKCGKGHRGGYHKAVESETAYNEYIKKDGGRGIDQWAIV